MDRKTALAVAGGVVGGVLLCKLLCAAKGSKCCAGKKKAGGCCSGKKKAGGCCGGKKKAGGCGCGGDCGCGGKCGGKCGNPDCSCPKTAGGAGAGAGAGAGTGKCPVTGATGGAAACPAKCSKCPHAASLAAAVTSDPVVVHYFGGMRGRAEQLRLALALSGVEFSDAGTPFGEMRASGRLAFGSYPLLELDGRDHVQAMATVAYIGRTRGFYPASAVEAYQVDSLLHACEDYRGNLVKMIFRTLSPEDFRAKIMTRWLPNFEKFVASNTAANPSAANRFAVGTSVTVADTTLFDVIDATLSLEAGALADLPALAAHYNHTKSVPAIAAYLAKRTSGEWAYPA